MRTVGWVQVNQVNITEHLTKNVLVTKKYNQSCQGVFGCYRHEWFNWTNPSKQKSWKHPSNYILFSIHTRNTQNILWPYLFCQYHSHKNSLYKISKNESLIYAMLGFFGKHTTWQLISTGMGSSQQQPLTHLCQPRGKKTSYKCTYHLTKIICTFVLNSEKVITKIILVIIFSLL